MCKTQAMHPGVLVLPVLYVQIPKARAYYELMLFTGDLYKLLYVS